MPRPRKRGAQSNHRDTPAAAPAQAPGAATGLAGLKSLHRTLVARRQAMAAEAAQARLKVQVNHQAQQQFIKAIGRVVPLKPTGRITPVVESPAPLPFQRWLDDHAVLRESVSDDYGAEWLLDADETLSYRRTGLGQDVVRKLRRGHWTVFAQLDLHGLRVDEAREALGAFLRDCTRLERRCVRVIHGKGLGSKNRTPVLKEKVRRWLTQKEEVLAFVEAQPNDGGSGVVLVLLRPSNRPAG